MQVTDYESLRSLLTRAMEEAGLLVKTDEVLYLNELTRACELFVQRPADRETTWAKVGFEWRAEDQAAVMQAQDAEEGEAEDGKYVPYEPQITIHAAFHLHFDGLDVDAAVIHEVTEAITGHAARFFGAEGSIVAELRLEATSARIDCLRYEIDIEPPADAGPDWWRMLGTVCAQMLLQFDTIHDELYTRFGHAH